jgi:hypothetical protein
MLGRIEVFKEHLGNRNGFILLPRMDFLTEGLSCQLHHLKIASRQV